MKLIVNDRNSHVLYLPLEVTRFEDDEFKALSTCV
jgi:hypothetical protein